MKRVCFVWKDGDADDVGISITADTALRLARYFGTSPSLWMNVQSRYELECAEDEIASEIEREVRPNKKTA